jgi:hypothetical protein
MNYQIVGRGLNSDELIICERVFSNALTRPFLSSKVMLYNGLGAGNRPFTSIDIGIGRYEIYIGASAFDPKARLTLDYKACLVHEMTHVWQMHHSWFGAVWISSAVNQACRQGHAYLYGEGNLGKKDWDDFGAEEQAQIVEDWFRNGLHSSDPRFQYIHKNIRNGASGFVSDTPSGTA